MILDEIDHIVIGWVLSPMTFVLIRIPDDTDSINRERSVTIVPSIRITYLQAKEFRLPATTRS